MYAPNMWSRFCDVPLVLMVIVNLVSCNPGARQVAAPPPESEQIIGNAMKDLYMASSASAPQSPAQQKLILRMAEKASNGKELFLVMRAAAGVFPPGGASPEKTVTAKMMEFATLDQMIDYAKQYSIDPQSARPYVQRMFQLGNESTDPRVWYRIRLTASRLKLPDLGSQAQAKGDQLAHR